MSSITTDTALLPRIHTLLPDDRIVTDADALETLAYDHGVGNPAGRPLAAVYPASTDEVSQVLRVAHETGTIVVPQGARTGVLGESNALDGALLLNLSRMNRILEVDAVNQLARVEPGVINHDLGEAAKAKGLYYPVDPGSVYISTIGGNVATNAGGMRCVKYGVTADSVRALTVVLADGTVLHIGHRSVKWVAGLDLVRLFAGSEGALGVITEITVALVPAPTEFAGAAGLFPTVAAAVDAAQRIMASPASPSALELLDGMSMRAINAYAPESDLPEDAGAMLIVESDETGRSAADAARFAGVFREAGATRVIEAPDADAVSRLLDIRRNLYPGLLARYKAILTEDVGVPRGQILDLYRGIERAARETGAQVATGGHVGDGNLHPLIGFDPDDAASVATAHAAFERILRASVALGGTISGEHGIGSLKHDERGLELAPEVLEVQRRIKAALDPRGILNPGRKV